MVEKSGFPEQIKNRWRSLVTGYLAHATHDGFTDMLYVFFPIWQSQFNLNFKEIGFFKTLFSGAMAVFQVPSGFLANRFGEIRVLICGTLLTSFSVLLFGWATTPIVLGCLLLSGGLGASVQHPLSSALISGTCQDIHSRRTALSTYNVSGDVGKLIFPAAAAFLIARFDWPSASRWLALFGFCVTLVLFYATRNMQAKISRSHEDTTRSKFSVLSWKGHGAFWSLSAIGVLDSATRTGFLTFLPFLLKEKGADVATIGIALSLIFAGGATGKFVCGVLAIRLGVLRSVIATEVITAVCIWGMLTFTLHSALLLAPVLGIALNGTSSVLYGSVPELVSDERRKVAFAIFYTVTLGSGAIAPSIYGFLSDIIGIRTTIFIVACIVLTTIPLTIPLRGKLAQDLVNT